MFYFQVNFYKGFRVCVCVCVWKIKSESSCTPRFTPTILSLSLWRTVRTVRTLTRKARDRRAGYKTISREAFSSRALKQGRKIGGNIKRRIPTRGVYGKESIMYATHTRASVYCAGRPPLEKKTETLDMKVPKPPDTHPKGVCVV